jgi:hypothetical protein
LSGLGLAVSWNSSTQPPPRVREEEQGAQVERGQATHDLPPTRTHTPKGQCRLAKFDEKTTGPRLVVVRGDSQGRSHCPCSRRRERKENLPTLDHSLLHHTDRQDSPFCGGQIFQSQGLVSIDRSMVAALLSTTPRLTPRSSANDLAPRHCTGMDIASASGKELSRPDPP